MRPWSKCASDHHQLINHLTEFARVLGQQRFALVAALWAEAQAVTVLDLDHMDAVGTHGGPALWTMECHLSLGML